MDHRSVLKGWQFGYVHGTNRRFVSRRCPAEDLLRSAPKSNESDLFVPEGTDAVRSFFGGFSSTAGYVPGNEARVPKDSSGVAPGWLIKSSGRYSFLSEQLGSALRPSLASLSASAPSVLDSGFPLLLSSDGASPLPSHLSVPV